MEKADKPKSNRKWFYKEFEGFLNTTLWFCFMFSKELTLFNVPAFFSEPGFTSSHQGLENWIWWQTIWLSYILDWYDLNAILEFTTYPSLTPIWKLFGIWKSPSLNPSYFETWFPSKNEERTVFTRLDGFFLSFWCILSHRKVILVDCVIKKHSAWTLDVVHQILSHTFGRVKTIGPIYLMFISFLQVSVEKTWLFPLLLNGCLA